MNANDIIEKCAEVADDYAAPNRFSVADCWKDGQSPSEVYDTAAIDVGGWIAQEIRALKSSLPAEKDRCLTEGQIKHLVDRFLQWRLPKDFNPDAGISYKRPNYAAEVDATPSGTNLFDAAQATDMVRFMVEGMPASSLPAETVSEAMVTAARDALSALEIAHKRLDPAWDGSATQFSVIGKCRAALDAALKE